MRPAGPVASDGRDGQAQTHGEGSRLPIFEGAAAWEWGRPEGEKTTGRGQNYGDIGKTRPDACPAGSFGRDGIPAEPISEHQEIVPKILKIRRITPLSDG